MQGVEAQVYWHHEEAISWIQAGDSLGVIDPVSSTMNCMNEDFKKYLF